MSVRENRWIQLCYTKDFPVLFNQSTTDNYHWYTIISLVAAIFRYSKNLDAFAGYSNESLYKYLSHALEEDNKDEVFSLYAGQCSDTSVSRPNLSIPYFLLDSLGVFAIKNLLHSNMSSVLSTSYDAVDTILDQLLPTNDAGGHVSVYLLDSSGFVVWTSDADQLQVGGQLFAKLQPLVFEDMVNNSVFIRRLFMGHEPKPCGIYTMPHSVTAACLDSAATSVHKVCLRDTQESLK